MQSRILTVAAVFAAVMTLAPVTFAQQNGELPRRPDGRPDLSGTYDIATLTPLQRPSELGDKLVLTAEEAAALAAGASSLERIFNIPDERNEVSEAPREAPLSAATGPAGRPATSAATTRSGWTSVSRASRSTDSTARRSSSTRRTAGAHRCPRPRASGGRPGPRSPGRTPAPPGG